MNDNPMPNDVYRYMLRFRPQGMEPHDLHHAIFDKGIVSGMPLEVRRMIHSPMNLLWIPKRVHASHLNIPSRAVAYKALCIRFGETAMDSYVSEMLSKFKNAPFTLESLKG